VDSWSVSQGAALVMPTVTIRDDLGNAITTYTGTEALSTTIWPGGNRAAAVTVAGSWVSAGAGTINPATLTAAQTTALVPSQYQGLTRLTPTGEDGVDVYAFELEIRPYVGAETAPTSYCSYADLLRYGRAWLRQLQTSDDEAGFAEQLGRARSWIDDLAHAHYRVAAMTMVIGSQAFGPRRSGARSTWLQEQLDADTLILTDQIREAAAKKALAFICEGQVGPGESSAPYARLARMYHSQADYLGTCLVLSLDTNGDGFPDVNIDCSCTDPMMA
jgi:hypothetical protein